MGHTTVTFLTFTVGAVALFFWIRASRLVRLSRCCGLAIAVCFAATLILPASLPALIAELLFMASLGAGITCASFSFVFALNPSERYFASALMVLSIALIDLLAAWPLGSMLLRAVLAPLLVAAIGFSLIRTGRDMSAADRPAAGDRPKSSERRIDPSIWLALYIFISYFAIRISGFYAAAFQHPADARIWRLAAIVLMALLILVQVVFRRSVWTLCTLFYILAITSHLMWYLRLPNAAFFFSESKEIGLLLAFYLVGCVTNRFGSFRLHKLLVAVCLSIIGLLYFGIDLLHQAMVTQPLAVIVAAVLFVVFLLLTPAYARHIFLAGWADELYPGRPPESSGQAAGLAADAGSADVWSADAWSADAWSAAAAVLAATASSGPAVDATATASASPFDRRIDLEQTALSPREKQVVRLLLQGKSLKQIAPELGLTVSTIATYNKAIHKKLGINSRAELFVHYQDRRGGSEQTGQNLGIHPHAP